MSDAKKEPCASQTLGLNQYAIYDTSYSDIRKWLKENKLTVDNLVLYTGISRPTVIKYTHKGTWPLTAVKRISERLDIPFEEVACRLAQVEPDSPSEKWVQEEVKKRLTRIIKTLVGAYL